MRNLVIAGMLAAFTAAVALTAVVMPGSALAAAKQKSEKTTKSKVEKRKKPTGKM